MKRKLEHDDSMSAEIALDELDLMKLYPPIPFPTELDDTPR